MNIYEKLYQMGFRTTRDVRFFFNHCESGSVRSVVLDVDSRSRYQKIDELFSVLPNGVFMKEGGISFYRALQGLDGFDVFNHMVMQRAFRNEPLGVLELAQNLIFNCRIYSEILKVKDPRDVPFHVQRKLDALGLYTSKTFIKEGQNKHTFILTKLANDIHIAEKTKATA